MAAKLALKRLTSSDLTLFEWQFRRLGVGGQKSINLNANIFVDQLFPAINEATRSNAGRIPLDLWVFGPGDRAPINIQRKIIKWGTYKNWRLDGEFITNPVDEPDRFNSLGPGDFVIFSFEGEVFPSSAMALFVGQAVPEDASLHAALSQLGFAGRDTMRTLREADITRLIAHAYLPEGHPLAGFALSDELQEAALGSASAVERLLRRARVPNLSIEALRRAREQAEEIGRSGEALIAVHLEQQKALGCIRSYEWVSEANAVAPMDFRISPMAGPEERIDVKTTAGQFDRPVHISWSELREIAGEIEGPYRIYRVYAANEQGGKLRVSTDLKPFARGILAQLAGLASGVIVDSFSVDPGGIQFEDEVLLAAPAEDDEL